MVENYLSSAPVIADFKSRLGQADEAVMKAASIAASARRAAADSDDAVQEVKKRLATTSSV